MTQQTKDLIQYGSAMLTLTSGIVMCFTAFLMGESDDVPNGALWYFGQTIVYAATIFGFRLAWQDVAQNHPVTPNKKDTL